MQPEFKQFVAQMEAFCIATGMPPSVSRILTYLTICQPSQQTSRMISESLDLSTGSVSEALTMLRKIEIIARTKKTGDKRFYYELDPDGWKRATIKKFSMLDAGVQLANSGLKIAPKNARLQSMHTMYSLFSREFADFAKQLK
jgi:DNA-binding transcriptional regulator GbsR (MarR family)